FLDTGSPLPESLGMDSRLPASLRCSGGCIMGQQFYSEINLHFVWHTKHSLPLLTPKLEKAAHGEIRKRILGFKGVILHILDGTQNHVHFAVSIWPTLHISAFVGDVKGGSSHAINRLAENEEPFAWQGGYGVVSFGTRDLT